MRKSILRLCALLLVISGTLSVRAQYYEIANQLTNLITPALSGSMNYKGFLDLDGVGGIGYNRANFLGISTTQGFTYGGWFFMGAGLGIDVAMAHDADEDYYTPTAQMPDWSYVPTAKTKVMMPIYSDFRINLGDKSKTGIFIDLRLGAAWFLGNSYLQLSDVRMSNAAQFYLRPTIGMRIPINSQNIRQAINIGATYQLITSNNYYSYYRSNNPTLNGLGLTIGFEW